MIIINEIISVTKVLKVKCVAKKKFVALTPIVRLCPLFRDCIANVLTSFAEFMVGTPETDTKIIGFRR